MASVQNVAVASYIYGPLKVNKDNTIKAKKKGTKSSK